MKQAMDGKADSQVWTGIAFSIVSTIIMSWQVNRIWTSLPAAAEIPDKADIRAASDSVDIQL